MMSLLLLLGAETRLLCVVTYMQNKDVGPPTGGTGAASVAVAGGGDQAPLDITYIISFMLCTKD